MLYVAACFCGAAINGLFTPCIVYINIRYFVALCFKVSSLSTVEQKACEFIGVTEGYLCSKVSGHGSKKVHVCVWISVNTVHVQ